MTCDRKEVGEGQGGGGEGGGGKRTAGSLRWGGWGVGLVFPETTRKCLGRTWGPGRGRGDGPGGPHPHSTPAGLRLLQAFLPVASGC